MYIPRPFCIEKKVKEQLTIVAFKTYLQGKEKVIMPKGKQLVTNGAGVTTEKVLENAK